MKPNINHFVFDKKPNDQSVRDEVLSPEKSFIVQAPAGSGKTELLVNRFIHLLSVVEEPEEIVAITFTKKAASEMAHRVIERLRLAKSHPEKLTEDVYRICRKVILRDKEKSWGLMENAQRLSIQTIDSFCLRIASQLPWTTGLGESPTMTDDSNELYQKAVAQVIDIAFHKESQLAQGDEMSKAVSDAISLLLVQHNFNLNKVSQQLMSLLPTRDQWLSVIFQSPSLKETKQLLEQNWHNLIADNIHAAYLALKPILNQEFRETLTHAANNLIANGEVNHDMALFADRSDFPYIDDECSDLYLKKWHALANFLTTGAGKPCKRYNVNSGIPPESKAQKTILQNVSEYLSTTPSALEKINTVKILPQPKYSAESWQQIEALYTLLKQAAVELLLVFKQHGLVDFNEVTSRVLTALTDDRSPLGLKLDYQIQHILIDEFQDTSNTQLKLLSALTNEWYQGDNRSLFLVGDPMQSIYKFRGANVAGFIKIFEHGLNNIDIKPRSLTTNFRSNQSIVEWINHHFVHIFSSEEMTNEKKQLGDINYAASEPFHGDNETTEVGYHVVSSPHRPNEADKVIELIRHYIKSTDSKPSQSKNDSNAINHSQKPRSIAILLQSRNNSQFIIDALNKANIASSNIKIKPLNKVSYVLDMAALSKAFIHFSDSIAWFSLLRAPWCGLPISAITKLFEDKNNQQNIWQTLQNAIAQKILKGENHLRLQHLVSSIAGYIYRLDLPLHHRVRQCWQRLYGLSDLSHSHKDRSRLFSQSESENIALFLKHLSLAESAGNIHNAEQIDLILSSLYAIDNNTETSNNGNIYQIEVMTIHNSKGLQFDHVILPGLSNTARNSEAPLFSWFEYMPNNLDGPRDACQHFQMINLISGFKDKQNIETQIRSDFINDVHKKISAYEQARLLYVACTRAINRLDLIFKDSKPAKNSLAHYFHKAFQHSVDTKSQAFFDAINEPAQKSTTNKSGRVSVTHELTRLSCDYIDTIIAAPALKVIPQNTALPFQWAGLRARVMGILIHEYLCDCAHERFILGNVNDALLNHWQNQLQLNGLMSDERDSVLNALQSLIMKMANSPKLQWILSPHHLDAHNEWPLTHINRSSASLIERKHMIVDRSFIDNGVRWVIDYKTGSHQGGNLTSFLDSEQLRYQSTMDGYARAIDYYDKQQFPIKLGLYFPIIDEWRSWNYQPN